MAWIEITEGIGNTNNRPIQGAIAKTHGFNECFSHE
jgi:hypothetical protein